MTEKKHSLINFVLNAAAAALWAASCIINTGLTMKILTAALCVLHGFLAGMMFKSWLSL